MSNPTSTETAQIILEQLGGRRALLMLGAPKQGGALAIESGLQVRCKSPKCNYITIVLTGRDDYTVTFEKRTGGRLSRKTYEVSPVKIKTVSEIERVSADALRGVIEQGTEMYLSI